MVSVFSVTDFIGKSVFAGFAFENVSDKAIGNKLFFERFRHIDEYDLVNLSTGKCNFIYEEYSADNASATRVQTTFQSDGVLSETTISANEKSSTSKEFTSYDGRKIYEEDAYKVRTV